MGTRHVTKVIKDNKIVVAQYGQWDGYPSGQGLTCFFFLQDESNIENLRNKLANVYYPADEELTEIYKPFEDGSMPGMMTMESGKAFGEKYPSLTRDTGAEILRVIADSDGPVPLVRDVDFENDALYCEGVYEINLDTNRFITKFSRVWQEESDNYGEWNLIVDLHIYEDVQKATPQRYLNECGMTLDDADEIVNHILSKA